ncbi:MAG: ABC transporter permease [Gemmiger sp.]
MWSCFCSEWAKLRRCQILLVGLVALTLCPLVQYGTQLIMEPELRDQNYDLAHLFSAVVWGNTQMFLPLSLVMIGGWMIDRETAQDTLKNLLCVPLSRPRLLGAKLAAVVCLALGLGVYSCAATLAAGRLFALPGWSGPVVLAGCGQILGASATTALVCLPLVLVFGQRRGGYLPGAILTFFLGYSILFFKSGVLLSAYPFSAALILVGFDMRGYNGATAAPQPLLSAVGLAAMPALALVLLALSGRWGRRTLPARAARHRRGRRR